MKSRDGGVFLSLTKKRKNMQKQFKKSLLGLCKVRAKKLKINKIFDTHKTM